MTGVAVFIGMEKGAKWARWLGAWLGCVLTAQRRKSSLLRGGGGWKPALQLLRREDVLREVRENHLLKLEREGECVEIFRARSFAPYGRVGGHSPSFDSAQDRPTPPFSIQHTRKQHPAIRNQK